MSLSLRSIDDLKLAGSRDLPVGCSGLYVIKICLQSNLASVYQESRLPMQRLLWSERWARGTAAFVYFRLRF